MSLNTKELLDINRLHLIKLTYIPILKTEILRICFIKLQSQKKKIFDVSMTYCANVVL